MSPVGATPLPTTALPPLLEVDAAAAAAPALDPLAEVLTPEWCMGRGMWWIGCVADSIGCSSWLWGATIY